MAAAVAAFGVPAPTAEAAPRMDSRLADVAAVAAKRGDAAGLEAARRRSLPVAHGALRVVVAGHGAERAARAAGTVEASARGLVQARIAPGRLRALSRDDSLSVRPPAEPHPLAIAGEGITVTNSAPWQALGVQGQGVKVAVIDRGFWRWYDRQAQGDLPASVVTRDFCDGNVDGTVTHGSAVAETVADLAPLVEMHLLCVNSEVTLAQAVDHARQQDVDVIVHALGWFGTSRGDGSGGASTPEGLAAAAAADGILWVQPAGNQARHHWGGTFADADRDGWHEWAVGDEGNQVAQDTGETACAYLTWDAWPQTTRDYDLYLVHPATGTVVASSENAQRDAAQAPVERACVPRDMYLWPLEVKVLDRSGGTPLELDLHVASPWRTNPPPLERWVSAGSLAEPAGSADVLTVGAHCVQDGSLEQYSSLGPTPDGRVKPDISGPDSARASTSPYYLEGACGSSGFPGTSAAAAHVAGIAAQVKSMEPQLGMTALREFMQRRAVDAGASGKDNAWGAGRLFLRPFADVAAGATWAGQAEVVFRRGIVRGRSDATLEPAGATARAEMAEYVIRAMGHADHLPGYRGYFSDMPASDPRTAWAEHLVDHGIVPAGGAFRPGDAVTRGDGAAWLEAGSGNDDPPPAEPAGVLDRRTAVEWIARSFRMRWFAHLPEGLVDDVVVVGERVWFTNEGTDSVRSYSLLDGSLEDAIGVGDQPRELDATPDGRLLVVTNRGSRDISVIDTASRTEARRIPVPPNDRGDRPYSIAVAANGKALFSTTTAPVYSGFSSRIMELDLSTWAVRERADLMPDGATTEATYLAPSGDRRRIFVVLGNISSGEVWAYDAATDSRVFTGALGDFEGYVAADRTGGTVAVAPNDALLNGDMSTRQQFSSQSFGIALSPGGRYLYSGLEAGLGVTDLSTGALVGAPRPLEDTISDALSVNYIYSAVGRMDTDAAGTVAAVVTDHGLTVVPTGRDGPEAPLVPADLATPETTIASGPSGTTSAVDATFAFTANESPVRFQCSLDGAAWSTCTSPRAYSGLTAGGHTFRVRAVDRAGNPDPSPAERTWTIDPAAPPPDPEPEPDPNPEPDPDPGPAPADSQEPAPADSGTAAQPGSPPPADTIRAPLTSPALALEAPRALRRPRISGRPRLGARLRALPGVWSGTGTIRFAYRWRRCDARGRRCRTLRGTRAFRRVGRADLGRRLRVVVVARSAAGTARAVSRPTARIGR